MRHNLRAVVLGAAMTAVAGLQPALAQAPAGSDPANTMVIELKTGKVYIKLRPDLAPKHVERTKKLLAEKFYDNLKWHRVITGFMAQTGDPKGVGVGGSKYGNVPAEFSGYAYKRGTIGAARTQDPNSANSQFFICFTDSGCASLTGQYTVWGEVVAGMEHVDQIERGEPPAKPDVMKRVYLLADEKKS